MYLKDPIKRVQYTFRIKEDLMEDLKVYAKAKDIKLPRLINDILEEHIKDMNLSNTWSNDPLDLFITIPKNYPKNVVNLPKATTSNVDGWQYEVKAMPTNLDVWNDQHGFISKQKDIKHEGVEPLLIPNYIEDLTLKKDDATSQAIGNCLIGLYFIEYEDGKHRVDLIQFNDIINKLCLINNEVAKYYKHYRALFNRLVNDNLANLNDANHDHIKQQLLDQLEDLALTINTGNVVAVEINQDMEQQSPKYDPSLPMYDLPKLLREINQLKKENEQYKEDMEKLTQQHDEVMEALATMEAVRKKLEELEAMSDAELWEMVKKESEK